MRRFSLSCANWIYCAALVSISLFATLARAEAPVKPADQAAQLVQRALQAEADGKPGDRADLLKQALTVAPDFAPGHWQSGEIRTGDKWTSIDNAAKQDAHSAKLDEYRKLRDQAEQTVDGQLNLARWCEKAGLKEQQRAHLMFVLELQPNNKEAISKLGLVRFQGQLIPATQLDEIKAKLDASTAVSKEWKARIDDWCEQLKKHPHDEDVLKQIRDVRDPAAIFALERGLAHSGQDACLAVIDALAAMPQQAATDSILHAAVCSPVTQVRQAAIYALRSRSRYSYIPLLLCAMRTPIKYEYDILNFSSDTFTHQLTLFQEGPSEDTLEVHYQSDVQLLTRYGGPDTRPARTQARATSDIQQARAAIHQINQFNQDALTSNGVLAEVLEATTGQQLGTDATAWWSWWLDDNEYYQPSEKPENVVSLGTTRRHAVSCFVAGTPVWTTSGPMQIEKIKVGELVLSQDPETGELAYKPVIGTTIRPESPLIETHLGDTLIRSTARPSVLGVRKRLADGERVKGGAVAAHGQR